MTEDEYSVVSDLAHVRDARRCVNAMIPQGAKMDTAWGTAIKGLSRLEDLLSARVEKLMDDEQ